MQVALAKNEEVGGEERYEKESYEDLLQTVHKTTNN